MFKDRYRADNDKIEPDEALLKYLSKKIEDAAAAPPAPEIKRRAWLRTAVALAACFAFVLTGVSISGHFGKSNNYTADNFNQDNSAQSDSVMDSLDNSQSEEPKTASYAKLYTLIKSIETKDNRNENYGMAADTGNKAAPAEKSSANSGSHSDTNVQVSGVDEADIVKTDGSYIYSLLKNRVNIIHIKGSGMEKASTIFFTEGDKDITNPIEFYICDNRLIILQNVFPGVDQKTNDSSNAKSGSCRYATRTQAAVYDISDRSKPVLLGTTGQSGGYLSSRMVGNTLYLISNYTLWSKAEEKRPESYVPLIYKDTACSPMAAENICLTDNPDTRQYIVVSAIDVQKPQEVLSSQSIFGCGTTLYANEKNIYIASAANEKSGEQNKSSSKQSSVTVTQKTNLIRLSLNNGQIAVAATGNVAGSLLNQYSMDEYNSTFRLVTTNSSYIETSGNGTVSMTPGKTSNALYTLNQDLHIVGSLTDIAKGERVYSVRFNGAIGYFVTFRQVDPLFAVDLSDPAKPKILSALKIPGLSDYLHPYSDGLLFGLGRDTNENTGHVNGLKLSMFDVSNPANVTEKNKLLLDERYSIATYNYKAIIVSADRSLIAFPAEDKYMIFTYSSESGFKEKAELCIGKTNYTSRGLFIDDTFYVCTIDGITAFSMKDYKLLASLTYSQM